MIVGSGTNFGMLSASMSRKLNERLKPEKSSLSYADLHHEITKSEEESTSKSHGNHQTQGTYGRASEEDEVVKYMSNLPGYLERGKKIGEKVLNVGVLDWARLEQWQYGHKHIPHRSSSSSTSTSNTSSSVSTDGLSGHSSRGHSWSPSRQRIFHSSLQSQFMASPKQGHSPPVKSCGEGVGNCKNLRCSHSKIDAQSKYVRADDHLPQNHHTSRLKGCDRKYLNSHTDKESNILPNDQRYKVASCAKLEMSAQGGGMEKRVETLSEPNSDTVGQGTLKKRQPIVLLLPRDIPQNSHSGAPAMQTSLGQKLGNSSQMSFSEKPQEPSHKYFNHDISHSCPLPDEVGSSHSQPKGSRSGCTDSETIKIPSSTFTAPLSVRTRISPSKSRKAEEKKHTIATTDKTSSSANGPSQGLDHKVTSDKSRSSSPFRRFSISIGYTSKGSGCKEGVHEVHQSSIAPPKSSSENVRGYASSNISGNDKPAESGKSRSSPLRRLLDPLLKPKAANCRHSMELSQKDSVLISKNCKSVNGNFSTLQPEKDLDRDHRVSCSTINTVDPSKDKKHVLSMTQALLRITVKNGLPLFTFAVDNNSNILAATVKNLNVSRKDECNRIYTFFTFRETKKKNGSWMNQAGKSKGPEYLHHVVAQMKVSDSHYYDLTSQDCMDSTTVKEFVLFSVKLRQGDAQATDYQPNDELAATVVKIPKANNFINDAHQSSHQNDGQDFVHATVVLPSGVHSLPSKGGPSSLIERWKSGGSCDCGGWDLGCKLKILANENQACGKSKSSKAYFADQFELFLQGNAQEHRPAFSFARFQQGIYSVAFDSSVSHLQAFSVCIALVDSKMPCELSGPRNSVEGKNSRETLFVQTDDLKDFGKLAEIPPSYVSYPPVSPVGRV